MKIRTIFYIVYFIVVIALMVFVLKTYTTFVIVNSMIVISMLLWQWRDAWYYITSTINNLLDYYENKNDYV